MATTPTKSTPKRDSSGKFTAGCAPGPGRPARPSAAKNYAEQARLACTPEELQLVVKRLLRQSQAGSLRASELLLKHFLPSMPQVDESRLDVEQPPSADEIRFAGSNRVEVMIEFLQQFVARAREVDDDLKSRGQLPHYASPSLPPSKDTPE